MFPKEMKQIDTQELRGLQMSIYDYIDRFCRIHHIPYTMSGGTLLGAVRHGGFIPWDDDMDMQMLRKDYVRFIEQWNKESHPFELSCVENRNAIYPFAKVIDPRTALIIQGIDTGGVFIDIFPVDKVTSSIDYHIRKKINRALFVLQYYIRRSYMRNKKNRKVFRSVLLSIINPVKAQKALSIIIGKVAQLREESDGQQVYELVAGVRCKDPIEIKVYRTIVDRQFEDRLYSSVDDYDSYLKATYGNYMQLPPEEKRVSLHQFTAYWR